MKMFLRKIQNRSRQRSATPYSDSTSPTAISDVTPRRKLLKKKTIKKETSSLERLSQPIKNFAHKSVDRQSVHR
jgi:hypothetical protein